LKPAESEACPAFSGTKLKIKRNINPVDISTKGYCEDIFLPQCRHFPLKIKKLKRGIKSFQDKGCLQLGQKEWPFRKLFFSQRR
jgi:hypothetical protein